MMPGPQQPSSSHYRLRQTKPPGPPPTPPAPITRSPFAWHNRKLNLFSKQYQQVAIKEISSISANNRREHRQQTQRHQQQQTVVVSSSGNFDEIGTGFSSNQTTPTTVEASMYAFDWPGHHQHQQQQQHYHHHHQSYLHQQQPQLHHQHRPLSFSTPSLDSSSVFDDREEAPMLKSHYRHQSKPNIVYGCGPSPGVRPVSYRQAPLYTFYGHQGLPPRGTPYVYTLPHYSYPVYGRPPFGFAMTGKRLPPPHRAPMYHYASQPNLYGGHHKHHLHRPCPTSLPTIYLPGRPPPPPLPYYPHVYHQRYYQGENMPTLTAPRPPSKQHQRMAASNALLRPPGVHGSRPPKLSLDYGLNRPSYVSMLEGNEMAATMSPNSIRGSTMTDSRCHGKLFVLSIILTVITIGVIMGVMLAVTID